MILKCQREMVKVNMIAWQEKGFGRHRLLLERKEVSIGHGGKSKACERALGPGRPAGAAPRRGGSLATGSQPRCGDTEPGACGEARGERGLAGWWPPRASSGLGPCPRLSDLIRSQGAGGKVPSPRWALSSAGGFLAAAFLCCKKNPTEAFLGKATASPACTQSAEARAGFLLCRSTGPGRGTGTDLLSTNTGCRWVVVVSGWWILQPKGLFN